MFLKLSYESFCRIQDLFDFTVAFMPKQELFNRKLNVDVNSMRPDFTSKLVHDTQILHCALW